MSAVVILESRIERKVCEYAEKRGMLHFKLTPTGQRGWMDRLFITPEGEHFYIEFKRENKKLEHLQAYRRWQLRQRHCQVYGPIDTVAEGLEIIEFHATKARVGTAPLPG